MTNYIWKRLIFVENSSIVLRPTYGNSFPRSLGKSLDMDAIMSGAGANDSGVASPDAASTVDDFRNVVLRKTRNSIVQRDIENTTVASSSGSNTGVLKLYPIIS